MLREVVISPKGHASLTLVLPFPSIPENVRNYMVNNLTEAVGSAGGELVKVNVALMNDVERQEFLAKEQQNWRGWAVRVLHIQQEWFDRLLPDGLPIPSSTLLSGPGGSGKPLIGNVIAAAWLRQGGSVIFMSLQYPDHSFIKAGLSKVAHLDLDEYKERVVFIELDATIDTMTEPDDNRFRANVVKPEVWDRAI
jgi:hypothetical protein